MNIKIFTDGSSKGNPGPGGWGALIQYKNKEKELFGGEIYTTNNRMELIAVISALNMFKISSEITIYTDSMYVKNGISKWIYIWKKNFWRTTTNKDVKNVDLWKKLYSLTKRHFLKWKFVRGHNGIKGNERADILAKKGVFFIINNYNINKYR